MGWEENYSEYDVVKDHTKVLSKIWDNLMPKICPHVENFETFKAVEVHKTKRMGPYHMNEEYIDYNCAVKIDGTPLRNIGWNGKDQITKEMVDEAYGENYFYNIRMKMVEVSKYAGIKFSNFDMGGNLTASVDDDN